jgi:hypothetical protein
VSYSPAPGGFVVAGPASAARWRGHQRLMAVAVGIALVGLLVTASRLTPSTAGLGTHRQLGLPPCTVVDWFGIRCPSCGMTTSWAHATHGQVLAAVQTNAGGALLALAAALVGPWLIGSGWYGRWLLRPPREGVVLAAGAVVIAVTLAQWVVRLALGW